MIHTINIPDLISNSPYLQIYNGNNSDTIIQVDNTVAQGMVWTVTTFEMRGVREKNPDVNFDRIQEMINSNESAMNELGLMSLERYAYYTPKLIRAKWDQLGTRIILGEFFEKNKTNITGVAL